MSMITAADRSNSIAKLFLHGRKRRKGRDNYRVTIDTTILQEVQESRSRNTRSDRRDGDKSAVSGSTGVVQEV